MKRRGGGGDGVWWMGVVCVVVYVCRGVQVWECVSFWRHPFLELGLESVFVCVCAGWGR